MTHSSGRNVADIKCSCIDQILKSTTPMNPFSCSTIKINQGIVDNSQQFLPGCGYSTFQCTFGRHVYIFSYPVPPAVLTTRIQVSLGLVPVTSRCQVYVHPSYFRLQIQFPCLLTIHKVVRVELLLKLSTSFDPCSRSSRKLLHLPHNNRSHIRGWRPQRVNSATELTRGGRTATINERGGKCDNFSCKFLSTPFHKN